MRLKSIILAMGCMLLAGMATAQTVPMKWGEIEQADLEMKQYGPDTTAKAVILGEYGEAYLTYNMQKGIFQVNLVHHVRIKVLEQEGVEWANVVLPLYHIGKFREEKILAVKGAVYNIEGGNVKETKFSKREVFEEALTEQIDLYKFTLANVKKGSVIEYEYHKVSDFLYGFQTWVFQHKIPCRWSEFQARIPEYFGYKNLITGQYPLAVSESSSYQDSFVYKGVSSDRLAGGHNEYLRSFKPTGVKHRWAMQQIPALKEEAYITTLSDYAAKIEFELKHTHFPGQPLRQESNDWDKLAKEFLSESRFGGELNKQRQVNDVVATLTAGKEKPEEKIAAIYSYIQQNIRYNGLERVYAYRSFKEVLARKEGSAAEVNLLLTAMLREAKLEANPVILSTRRNGRVNPVIPLEKDFNYVVCHVALEDSRFVLLDATDPYLPLGMLPYRCMNNQGRIISEEFTSWINLHNGERESVMLKAKLKIAPGGTMAGTLSYTRGGYEAATARRAIIEEGEEKYLQNISTEHSNWVVSEKKLANAKAVSEKLEEHFTLEIRDKVTVAGDKLYVQLLPEGVLEKNPFIMDNRSFPVDFGCFTDNMLAYELELPEGYQVEQLPQATILTLPDKSAVFRYSVVQLGTKVSVTSSMQINKAVFASEEYQHLKDFYRLMLAKQNEQVVLVKKAN